jgi:3-oxoacyl-[acyl-carrier-protein] synthase II
MSDRPAPSGRVVVTGLGAVTPLATGVDKFWPKLLAGENGVARVTHLDPSEYATQIAAEVKDFNAEDWLDRKEARRVDRFIAFAVASATMALQDSKIELTDDLRNDFGVCIGSGIGGLTLMGEQHRRQVEHGPGKVTPFLVPYMIPDMASGFTSIVHDLRGPNTCVVTACSTGANAIGDAYHIIKRGDAVAMLAGGTEAPINEIGLAAFSAARAMTTRNHEPHLASRPFDLDRDGFVIAEGSAVLVMEDYDHAIARGAKIYGELIGYGMSGDAYHITQPRPDAGGAIRAMEMAFKRAGITPEQIGYINAHGTSTYYNDKLETMAIKHVFGDYAYKVPISSIKSMIGHTLGASGAIAALVCLLAMRDSKLPPTINLGTPDPDCDLDYIPHVMREAPADYSLLNSFGFGGHNVTLILKKL